MPRSWHTTQITTTKQGFSDGKKILVTDTNLVTAFTKRVTTMRLRSRAVKVIDFSITITTINNSDGFYKNVTDFNDIT